MARALHLIINDEESESWDPSKSSSHSWGCFDYVHSLWQRFDRKVMKPMFGGHVRPVNRSYAESNLVTVAHDEIEAEEEDVEVRLLS